MVPGPENSCMAPVGASPILLVFISLFEGFPPRLYVLINLLIILFLLFETVSL